MNSIILDLDEFKAFKKSSGKDISKVVCIDTPIFLKIDIKGTDFKKNIIYALKYGFKFPVILSKIFDIDFGEPYLFLYTKFNHNLGKYNGSWRKNVNFIIFAIKSYVGSKAMLESNCNINFFLSEDSIYFLRQYTRKYKFMFNEKQEQREISGKFSLFPISGNSVLLYVKDDEVELGEKEQTGYINTIASFHTHPLEAYKKYKVCIAWPSIDDYVTFLSIYASGYGFFHIVSTMEGIYVVSISDELLKLSQEEIEKNFEYYENFIRKNYGYPYPVCDLNKKNNSLISEYVEKINKKPYFKIQFIKWNNKNMTFNIHYKRKSGNCFTKDEQIRFKNLIS